MQGLQCMAGQAANCQLQQRLELPPTCCDCKRGNSPCHCPCCSSLPASVSLSLLLSTLPAPCLPHSPWQRETASHGAPLPTFLSVSVSLPAFLTISLPLSLSLCSSSQNLSLHFFLLLCLPLCLPHSPCLVPLHSPPSFSLFCPSPSQFFFPFCSAHSTLIISAMLPTPLVTTSNLHTQFHCCRRICPLSYCSQFP